MVINFKTKKKLTLVLFNLSYYLFIGGKPDDVTVLLARVSR